jgi:hypothetical protein
MNDFESERAAKAARFRQLAEKHTKHYKPGDISPPGNALEMIPLGQPILVGHHSQKRRRKDLTQRRIGKTSRLISCSLTGAPAHGPRRLLLILGSWPH